MLKQPLEFLNGHGMRPLSGMKLNADGVCIMSGMKNCYVKINLLVTRKNRLLHRKCFVRILFTSRKTLETS